MAVFLPEWQINLLRVLIGAPLIILFIQKVLIPVPVCDIGVVVYRYDAEGYLPAF